jgi:hypothetical protein
MVLFLAVAWRSTTGTMIMGNKKSKVRIGRAAKRENLETLRMLLLRRLELARYASSYLEHLSHDIVGREYGYFDHMLV